MFPTAIPYRAIAASTSAIAGIAALTMAVAVQPASAQHGAFSAACHTVSEVGPTFFAKTQTTAFDFTGSDAARLSAAIDALSGEAATEPVSTLHLVIEPTISEFNVFLFGADGCYTGMVAGLNFGDITTLFALAGVAPPKALPVYERPSIAI